MSSIIPQQNSVPRVLLFSGFCQLTEKLIEELLNNQCYITLVNTETDWITSSITNRPGVEFINSGRASESQKYDYVIDVLYKDGQYGEGGVYYDTNIDLAKETASTQQIKSLFVLPGFGNVIPNISTFDYDEILKNENLFSGIIFVPRNLNEEFLHSVINEDFKDKDILKALLDFQPDSILSSEEVSKQIVRMLFSLSAYGKITSIKNKDVNGIEDLSIKKPVEEILIDSNFGQRFNNAINDVIKKLETSYVDKEIDNLLSKNGDEKDGVSNFYEKSHSFLTSNVEEDSEFKKPFSQELRPTQSVESIIAPLTKVNNDTKLDKLFIENSSKKRFSIKRLLKVKSTSKKKTKLVAQKKVFPKITLLTKKYVFYAITFILVFFISPFIFLSLGVLGIKIAENNLNNRNTNAFYRAITFSKFNLLLSKNISDNLAYVPLLDSVYDNSFSSANSMLLVQRFEKERAELEVMSLGLIDKLKGSKEFDVNSYSSELSLRLRLLFYDLSFIQSERENNGIINTMVTFALKNNLDSVRSNLLQTQKITNNLPSILGKGRPKVYLVLFQDNNVLRATGGQIRSLGLVTFSDGKLIDLKTYTTDYVDNQLVGDVEPPEPIKSYFNQDQWLFKDANWYLDFSSSAQKAEWFIEKELDTKVDGVVAFNGTFLNSLVNNISGNSNDKGEFNSDVLGYTDYMEDDNSYSKVSELSVINLLNSSLTGRLNISPKLGDGFENKNIQIYFNDQEIQNAFQEISGDYTIENKRCANNCYQDMVGVIEDQKERQNKKVVKDISFETTLEKGVVKRKLTIQFNNSANEASYTSYLRVLAGPSSGFSAVKISNKDKSNLVIPSVYGVGNYKEAGVIVDVKDKEIKKYEFNWEGQYNLDFDSAGDYYIYWIKQAGVNDIPVEVGIRMPLIRNTFSVYSTPAFSLTNDGVIKYNTQLSRDFISHIFWK